MTFLRPLYSAVVGVDCGAAAVDADAGGGRA